MITINNNSYNYLYAYSALPRPPVCVMRFNKQELATLAQQPSNKFEREGTLYITEKQDGFFRRTEGMLNLKT